VFFDVYEIMIIILKEISITVYSSLINKIWYCSLSRYWSQKL